MNERHLTASALLAATLFLTGCGAGSDAAAGSGSGSGGSSASAEAEGNDADIAFLTGMKPHHEQAVEMSETVLAADPPAEVAAIAEQVKAAQAPEIEQIDTMLSDLGEQADGSGHGGGHSTGTGGTAGHEGMMSDEEMSALMDATGTDAARLYLEGMVEHHQGAIAASDTEIADGQYRPAIDLAEKIRAAQAAEITTMQALLKGL